MVDLESIIWILFVVAVVISVVGLSLGAWFFAKSRPGVKKPAPLSPSAKVAEQARSLESALTRTRGRWWEGLTQLRGRNPKEFGSAEWEMLEETLLSADVSLKTSERLIGSAKELSQAGNTDFDGLMRFQIESIFSGVDSSWSLPEGPRPYVVSIVGVNGVGKTTTVGKLAHRFTKEGKTVLVGACDSFRAAAIDQLRVWADRAGCQIVAGREGADPGATAFDALSAGQSRGADVVLLDTAGRLHTKTHLMDELKRVHKVMKKVIPEAPHEIWMVIDGTLGQNSLAQAKQFHESLGLSGFVITKLDGTAKGGAVLSIVNDLQLPIRFVGIGESAEDLIVFKSSEFAEALLRRPSSVS